jgi:hypothetical protein
VVSASRRKTFLNHPPLFVDWKSGLRFSILETQSLLSAKSNNLNIGVGAQRPRKYCTMASRTTARENGASREKSPRISSNGNSRDLALPQHSGDVANGAGESRRQKLTPPIKAAGESGRRGIHPLHFFKIVWRSTSTLSRAVNVLWPLVPAAIAVYWRVEEHHTLKFVLAYLAMIPCANLIGFAGQELARKMPHMLGVLVETTSVPPDFSHAPLVFSFLLFPHLEIV